MYQQAESLMRGGAWEDARAECSRLCEAFPGHAQAHAYHGLSLYRLGRFEEAADELRKAVTLNPGHWEAGVKLAQCLDRLRRYEDAYDVVLEFLRLRPDEPSLHALAHGLREYVPQRVTDAWQKTSKLDHLHVEFADGDEVILPLAPPPDTFGPRRT